MPKSKRITISAAENGFVAECSEYDGSEYKDTQHVFENIDAVSNYIRSAFSSTDTEIQESIAGEPE